MMNAATSHSDNVHPERTHSVTRRSAVKGLGLGLSTVLLPDAVASASNGIFNGSGYTTESGATMQLRYTSIPNSDKTVRLQFHRTAYVTGTLSVTIDWGDGTEPTTTTSATNVVEPEHTYASGGTYTVSVTSANSGIGFGSGTVNSWNTLGGDYVTDVLAWDNIGSLRGGFQGFYSLSSVPNVLPLGVTDLSNAFYDCMSLNCELNNWNTSYVTKMEGTFQGCSSFNKNIGSWNVSNVTTMRNMFRSTTVFNNGGSDSIKNWNTAKVTDMNQMFVYAYAFNQPIGSWNVSEVTDMRGMFIWAQAFNNGGSTNIDTWNTAKVTDMEAMFQGANAFNQPIGGWNVGAVTNMAGMFQGAIAFNNGGSDNIRNWNTASVTNMNFMFSEAVAFNQPIGYNAGANTWNTSAVTQMNQMFRTSSAPAMAFDQDISNWLVANVTGYWGFVNLSYIAAGWTSSERPSKFGL